MEEEGDERKGVVGREGGGRGGGGGGWKGGGACPTHSIQSFHGVFFKLHCLSECSTSRYTCKELEQQMSRPG